MTAIPAAPAPNRLHRSRTGVVGDPAALIAQRARLSRLALGVAVIWMVYSVTGFRPPWASIRDFGESSHSAVRQLVFSGAGGLVAVALLCSGRLGAWTARLPVPWLLGGLMILSAAWSADPGLTLRRGLIFPLGLVVLLAATQAPRDPIHAFQRCVTGSAGLLAIGSLLVSFTMPAANWQLAERPGLAGLAGHPNTLAPALQAGLLLGLGRHPQAGDTARHRWLHRALLLAIAWALIGTGSVTALSATLFGVAIWIWLSATPYRAGLYSVVTVGTIGALIAVGYTTLSELFFAVTGRDAHLSGRDVLWSRVFAIGMESPLWGNGYGAFWYPDRGLELVRTWNPSQSHNAYLDVFLDLGLVGFVLVLVALFGSLWSGWLTRRSARGSDERTQMAAVLAMALSLLLGTAFSESFLLRVDKLPFFVLLWATLLVSPPRSQRHGSPSLSE